MDEIYLREDSLLIEKNGEVMVGNPSTGTVENLPSIRPRPADDAPRSDWVDYAVDLGASRPTLEADGSMSLPDLIIFADAMRG